ncbi:MAG: Holliday junction branch migration DNA helicase RuvB [Chloroflexi bacterium]|nr:Holliday junction branch migration DNA helicase RuvB [Chloroflexota bacterium]MCI0829665.1 Holliday junction branch migration DNA helicase RuvB [Chloroflexota bacterium]MCI0864668.1 Holliday junction branch migration DNA helicase RuvB [Chloroflexota bacterium]
MAERLVSGDLQQEDQDVTLRPKRLEDFVGQANTKENLSISIQAAKMRQEPLDHVIIYGPPGLGKTTLGNIIAAEMGVAIRVTSGPAIERAGDMAAILTSLEPGEVLFIDEVHRLNRVVEEVMYSAMEDFFLSWMVGKGLAARNVNLRISPFTLVGATTRYSMVSAPLRDRFGSVYRLDYYEPEDMTVIVDRSARILGVDADKEGLELIASRSRGTPRVANRLLKRTRDYALVKADNRVDGPVARAALEQLNVDELGLDRSDHRLLTSIIDKFDGGPVGLETLAASLNEDADTIMEVWEPYLLQLGFLERTPRGRVATRLAHAHLGRPYATTDLTDQGRLNGF